MTTGENDDIINTMSMFKAINPKVPAPSTRHWINREQEEFPYLVNLF